HEAPLLARGLALTCGTQIFVFTQTMQGLRLRVAAGAWHSEAVAASNISLLDAETTPPRVYVEELKPTPEGDLEILLQKRWVENHECVEKTLMAQKTEDPTVFTVDYHGERKISVLDTDYSSYMTFCKEGPTHTDEGSLMYGTLGGAVNRGHSRSPTFMAPDGKKGRGPPRRPPGNT
uniref:Lipocalin/cytosolic fatty-acid binding domain-containing protein n=1 Tax=Capra hircus TaxID=9925 RepID=A0A8C2P7R4_CAPHI